MALQARRVPGPIMPLALAIAHNKLCAQSALVGALFHADISSNTSGDASIAPAFATLAVTAAASTDLPTCIALATNIIGVCKQHMAEGIAQDTYSAGAHKISDAVNIALLPAIPVDLASLVASLNTLKSTINAHFIMAAPSAVHFNNDATNTIGTAAATVLADSITLANAIKTAVNAHILSGPTTPMIKILAP